MSELNVLHVNPKNDDLKEPGMVVVKDVETKEILRNKTSAEKSDERE